MTDRDRLERFMSEVYQMRDRQIKYFRDKSQTNMKYAKGHEQIVDERLTRLIRAGYVLQDQKIPQQKNLL